jgi:hypothetical protein
MVGVNMVGINNMVKWPRIVVIEIQRPLMQIPPPVRRLFQPSPVTQLEDLANQAPISPEQNVKGYTIM